jgi:hypothetical protein
MNVLEQQNLREIESLNQRGGPTLSVVDLIEAGTLSVELAGYFMSRVSRGASFFTAAVPGGAGKSTVLANLLCFLPPGERIVSTSSDAVVHEALGEQDLSGTCFLAHEIGSGHWYGYIWGSTVADFVSLKRTGARLASCLHADTLEQVTEILTGSPLDVAQDALTQVDLLGFVHILPGRRRRLGTVYEADERGHQLTFELDGGSDTFVRHAAPPDDHESACAEFIGKLVEQDVRRFEDVREAVVKWYRANA